MYVHKATVCVLESFVIRANFCTFIAAKFSQIALLTYTRSLGASEGKTAFARLIA